MLFDVGKNCILFVGNFRNGALLPSFRYLLVRQGAEIPVMQKLHFVHFTYYISYKLYIGMILQQSILVELPCTL